MKPSRMIMNFWIKVAIYLCLLSNTFLHSQDGILKKYCFNGKNVKQIVLPQVLNEISGLALYNNRLFCHNDEYARIYEINKDNGEIIKSFKLGNPILKGDFEDLVILDGKFYLISSNGTIYSFSEGENNESVGYKKYKTELKTKNDVEGIYYSNTKNELLLVCKEFPGKKYKGNRAVYEIGLKDFKLNNKPKYLINIKDIKSRSGRKAFNPSAIKLTKIDTYLILDGKGKTLVEISLEGKILNVSALNKEVHQQPEGIEILEDDTIIISDESINNKPTLTFYRIKR